MKGYFTYGQARYFERAAKTYEEMREVGTGTNVIKELTMKDLRYLAGANLTPVICCF